MNEHKCGFSCMQIVSHVVTKKCIHLKILVELCSIFWSH